MNRTSVKRNSKQCKMGENLIFAFSPPYLHQPIFSLSLFGRDSVVFSKLFQLFHLSRLEEKSFSSSRGLDAPRPLLELGGREIDIAIKLLKNLHFVRIKGVSRLRLRWLVLKVETTFNALILSNFSVSNGNLFFTFLSFHSVEQELERFSSTFLESFLLSLSHCRLTFAGSNICWILFIPFLTIYQSRLLCRTSPTLE